MKVEFLSVLISYLEDDCPVKNKQTFVGKK